MPNNKTCVFVIFLLIPNWAHAQSAPKKTKVFKMKDIIVPGEVQAPQINIYLSRVSDQKVSKVKLKQSFIPKIKESIQKKPL